MKLIIKVKRYFRYDVLYNKEQIFVNNVEIRFLKEGVLFIIDKSYMLLHDMQLFNTHKTSDIAMNKPHNVHLKINNIRLKQYLYATDWIDQGKIFDFFKKLL